MLLSQSRLCCTAGDRRRHSLFFKSIRCPAHNHRVYKTFVFKYRSKVLSCLCRPFALLPLRKLM